MALDVDADGKLQLSCVKDSASQLWCFRHHKNAHPKSSQRLPLSNAHENEQHPYPQELERSGTDTTEDSLQNPLSKRSDEDRPVDTAMIRGHSNVVEQRED